MPRLIITNECEAKRFLAATFKLRRKTPHAEVPDWGWRAGGADGKLEVAVTNGHLGAIVRTEVRVDGITPDVVWRVPDRAALDRAHRAMGSGPCDLGAVLAALPSHVYLNNGAERLAKFPHLEKVMKLADETPTSEGAETVVSIAYLAAAAPLLNLHTGRHDLVHMRLVGDNHNRQTVLWVGDACKVVIMGGKL